MFIGHPPNQSAFEEFFLPVLPRLSQDVVDVRVCVAQTVAALFISGKPAFVFRRLQR